MRASVLAYHTATIVVAVALSSACGSTESTCEERGDCRNPCVDPEYVKLHQDVCPCSHPDVLALMEPYPEVCGDAGTGGTAGVGGTGGTAGAAGHDAGDAETGAGGADAGDAGDATDAEAEPYCDPTLVPGENPCVIDDDYGIFVSPSGTDTASCGSQAAPCATIGQGMLRAKAEDKRVYACGDGGTYEERVAMDVALSGLELYGGFACATWDYTPGAIRARVMPATEGPALEIDAVTALEVRDFAFESRNATTSGASSIAAFVRDSAGVIFRNATFTSGKGASGSDGTPGPNADPVPVVGQAQQGLASTCGSLTPNGGGGWLVAHTCPAGGSTRGGQGGTAIFGQSSGQPGGSGTNGEFVTNVEDPAMGVGGDGGTAGDIAGNPGQPGSTGLSGTNGPSAGPGVISSTGFVPATGNDGTNGHPGQGGGGSGASWSKDGCVGPSGGAGGLGGCGGFGATGAGGGGASVALIVWSSAVALHDCELASGDGGKGGDGGDGGAGSSGRPGAAGGTDVEGGMASAGQGGLGGNGGPGGSGSGGSGGPSYPLVYHGTAPVEQGAVIKTPGLGGPKGVGGQAPGGTKAPDGQDGGSSDVLEVI